MKINSYEKALYLYNNARIEKAIEICEKDISRDLSNSKVLNLKGLLLYLKGDLEDAIALWKINSDYNNDEISSAYLKDIQSDFNKIQLYNEAKNLIENLSISEAITILEKCSESHCNFINVNISLALCYFKKGEKDKVKEYLDKVFKLDINNKEAKIINKKLESVYRYKNKKENLLKFTLFSLLILAFIIVILFKREQIIILNVKDKIAQTNNNSIKENKEIINNEVMDLENKNENKEINMNSDKEINLIKDEDVKNNYIKATDYYECNKYKEAIELLEKTLRKSNENHLDDDIIFLLASSYEADENINKAIENYDKYILKYESGSYIQEIYYRLALLYRNIDIQQSKKYANEIIIKYPKSIYNNNYVKEIIKL